MDTREKLVERYNKLKNTLSPEANALIIDLLQRDLMSDDLISELILSIEEEKKEKRKALKSFYDLMDRA